MMKSKYLKYICVSAVATLLAVMASACGKKEPGSDTRPEKFDNVVLVYAASANNLYSNLHADKREMLEGLEKTNPAKTRLLLLETTLESSEGGRRVILLEGVRSGGKFVFREIKSFSPDVYTTDPARLAEVLDYVTREFNSEKYGLVLWSHGGAWDPYGNSRTNVKGIGGNTSVDVPEAHWWGDDKIDGVSDRMNIDELASAIPSGLLHFIWFDCCYMSNIETIYQLRDKCRHLAAYPTEVYNPGMDYTRAVPALLKSEPDLPAAAKALYDYYTGPEWTAATKAVTVGVFDMTHIGGVADAARKAFASYVRPSADGLLKYSRGGVSSLYDLRQTMERVAESTGIKLDSRELDEAFGKFTVVKYASEEDFNSNPIAPEHFSGLSTHIADPADDSAAERYFRSLDWTKEVYPF